tara:strand:- start:64740 stop:64976 length:237 start_codon:yes stop_codon:yes gene_type:complete
MFTGKVRKTLKLVLPDNLCLRLELYAAMKRHKTMSGAIVEILEDVMKEYHPTLEASIKQLEPEVSVKTEQKNNKGDAR